jgi:hypothetical protein
MSSFAKVMRTWMLVKEELWHVPYYQTATIKPQQPNKNRNFVGLLGKASSS